VLSTRFRYHRGGSVRFTEPNSEPVKFGINSLSLPLYQILSQSISLYIPQSTTITNLETVQFSFASSRFTRGPNSEPIGFGLHPVNPPLDQILSQSNSSFYHSSPLLNQIRSKSKTPCISSLYSIKTDFKFILFTIRFVARFELSHKAHKGAIYLSAVKNLIIYLMPFLFTRMSDFSNKKFVLVIFNHCLFLTGKSAPFHLFGRLVFVCAVYISYHLTAFTIRRDVLSHSVNRTVGYFDVWDVSCCITSSFIIAWRNAAMWRNKTYFSILLQHFPNES
jgi:hypothetical protein